MGSAATMGCGKHGGESTDGFASLNFGCINKTIQFLYGGKTKGEKACFHPEEEAERALEHSNTMTWTVTAPILTFPWSCSPPSLPGLQTTRLGNHLEDRVNKFLRRQNHPEAGEVFVRVVASSDKTVEVKPGMKSRLVLLIIMNAILFIYFILKSPCMDIAKLCQFAP